MTTDPKSPPVVAVEGLPVLPEAVDYWGSPEMQKIERTARERDVPKMCLLVQTLTMLSAEIHPRVVIQDVGKGQGNLNMFAAIIGHSGAGKSTGSDFARDLIGREQTEPINLSSGEGMLNSFKRYQNVKVALPNDKGGVLKYETQKHYIWRNRSCIMQVDEGATMKKVLARQGVTIMGFLNTAWSGGALLTTTATEESTRKIPKNEYRFSGIINVQEGVVDLLIGKDAANGTTQRFIFAKATFENDHEFPDLDMNVPPITSFDLNELPELVWVNRDKDDEAGEDIITFIEGPDDPEPKFIMRVTPEIAYEVRTRQRAAMLENSKHPLDGHMAYSQLKVAALMALLHSRPYIVHQDWKRAEMVVLESDRVRGIFEKEAAREVIAKAQHAGVINSISKGSEEKSDVLDVAKTIVRYVREHAGGGACENGCIKKCVRGNVTPAKRQYIELAFTEAVSRSWLRVEIDESAKVGHTGRHYFPGEKRP